MFQYRKCFDKMKHCEQHWKKLYSLTACNGLLFELHRAGRAIGITYKKVALFNPIGNLLGDQKGTK